MKLILPAVLSLVLVACGSGDGASVVDDTTSTTSAASTTTTMVLATTTTAAEQSSSGDLMAFRQAAAQSAAATSARFEGTMTMAPSAQLPEPFTVYLEGAFNSERVELQMDMSEALAGIGASQGVDLSSAGDFSDVRFIFDGDNAYMLYPLFALMGVQTDWVLMSAGDAIGAAGVAGLSGIGTSSPVAALAAYVDAGAEITKIGTETIRGEDTTHYRLLLNVDDLEAATNGVSAADLRAAGIEELPLDVWIAPGDLIYRYEISLEGAPDMQVLSTRYEFYDYGENITIDLPNEDNVTPMDSLTP